MLKQNPPFIILANLIFSILNINMIYSKKIQNYVPVQITSDSYNLEGYGRFTRYQVKDNRIPVGYVDLLDTKKGVHVEFIKNQNPQLYSGFGFIADQLEVEHCIKRKLKDFEILSEASLNSHALHFLRGKRFFSEEVETAIKEVIANTPKGQQYYTAFLNKVKMYMPKDLIQKYIEKIKKSPLILK